MTLASGGRPPRLVARRARERSTPAGDRSIPRLDARTDGPSLTELAVEKLAGLLALATGVGLLAPLVFAIQRDDADGIGAAVVAVLSGITLIAGIVLLVGSRSNSDGRERGD